MTVTQYVLQTQTARRSAPYTVLLRSALLILILLSIYAASQQLTPNESVFSTKYGFGPVIRSLVEQHRFGALNNTYGWWCYAGRLPIVPFLGAAAYSVSPKMVVFLFLKNLLFWPLWVYAFFRLKRHYSIPDKWALLTVLLLLVAPYNLSIAGRVDVEEGYLFALIALFFSLLLTLRGTLSALALGVIMAVIYLTKSSMFPLCVAGGIWLVIRYWRKRANLIFLPLAGLALAVCGWGIYTRTVSGTFAFGSNASSWNGWNFYKGNNPYAYSLYPRVNLDVLDHEDYAHKLLPLVPVHNEWELSRVEFAMAQNYMRQNPSTILKMDLKKAFVACCDLKDSPEVIAGHTRPGAMLSNVVNHLTLACVCAFALVNIVRRRASQAEILAIVFTITYVLPYFGGFLYMRHMVPVYGVMALTAAVQLTRWGTRLSPLNTSLA
jgi:hypothetical protein